MKEEIDYWEVQRAFCTTRFNYVFDIVIECECCNKCGTKKASQICLIVVDIIRVFWNTQESAWMGALMK